ncbi:unnamed protein product [Durusdinium trenchii]|uniref:Uncharacterized protein n=1 Tax=Durusdinium trenchii TaxID=1381693 RepID=A0ABP0KEH4_9DINO
MSQEEFDDLGYPSIPSHWTKEWMLQQLELEKVDPRVNPNLLLEETSQEFWDNMSRKPYAKAILKNERHWTNRRNVWLRQLEQVELANALRAQLTEELEQCAPQIKRLVAPIMKYKITEIALSTSLRLAQQQRTSLNQLLEGRPDEVEKLRSLRTRLDEGGRDEAARLLDEFTARAKDRLLVARKGEGGKGLWTPTRGDYKQAERSEPMVLDTDTMAKLMTRAQKLRKDPCRIAEGVLWRKLLKAGARVKPASTRRNKMVKELHVILLKNVAQAAIKLGHWTDALRAADDCLAIDDQEIWDHKAWFRRACALEGLGRYAEEEEALAQVESIAVGRRHVAMLESQHQETEGWQMRKALQQGVFAHEELEDTEERLEDLEQELKELEAEEAALEEATAEECPFSVGDCVVLRAAFAEWPAGHRGTVAAVDGDGDMKVLFDGETEAQLILSIDFDLFTSVGSESAERVEPEPPALEKVLTVEGAQDLLEALASSYEDSGFQQQVAKLCRDTRWRKEDFMRHLPKVALERQKSILPSFGFEASVQGAQEAEKAIAQAKERAKEAKRAELQQRADAVTRSLFGEMYEIIFVQPAR